ncbi:DUF371 domain-containing protein [Sulfolobus sp. E5]|nr:DUF371 domain-containing protein [Sulfolobus sp. E5]
MIEVEEIIIKGHKNVKGTHKTTFEITRDDYLTPKGDCIIGILASKGSADLSQKFKELVRNDNTFIYAVIKVENLIDIIHGRGSSQLELNSSRKMVFRKSNYVEGSTVMIRSDKAARDINRMIIQELKKGKTGIVYVLASDKTLEDKEILRIVLNLNPFSIS